MPLEAWHARHRSVVVLLWLHAAAVPLYAIARGFDAEHVVLESSLVPLAALVASLPWLSKRLRSLVGSLGLLTCSAVLVHLSGGLIEMHFHYFVVIVLISLYEDWLPFLAAIAFVLLHHGLAGAIDPESVFNHAAAINNPWRWSAIHAVFVGGIVSACLATWRLDERHLDAAAIAQQRLQAEIRLVERLNDAGAALVADLDADRVVQRVVDLAAELSDAERGAFVYEGTTETEEPCLLAVRSGSGLTFEVPASMRDALVLAMATRTAAPVGLKDLDVAEVADEERADLASLVGAGAVHSVLAVPVVVRSEVTGVLVLTHSQRAWFTESRERAATGVANRAGAAIENARLYSVQRAAAATLQQALLPERLPDIPGLSLAARYVPGGPECDVGGDWYDVFALPDGSFGFAMGDVVGRGLGAAALMGQLRDALRAYALEGYTPGVALGRLNRMACSLGLGYVATVVFVSLDPSSGVALVANAGHLPLLLVEDGGSSRFVRCDSGIPLGVLDTIEYSDTSMVVAPGSSLVLYTDGLVEDRTTSLDEGLDRLRRAAAREGSDDPRAICARVLEQCAGTAAGDDDTALLIVHRAVLANIVPSSVAPHDRLSPVDG